MTVKQTHFEKIILDADTPLFKAVKSVEEDYVEVTFKATGTVKEYKTLTVFYGHHGKKEKGKLAEMNLANGTSYTHEDFSYEQLSRLKPSIEAGTHLDVAMTHFDTFIGKLFEADFADGLEVAVGGTKCHRHDLANVLKYKGERKAKPLLFAEFYERVVDEYASTIVVCDGMEADDYLAIKAHENFKHYQETGEWLYLLAFIDKDIKIAIGPSIDYYQLGKGIFYQSIQGAAMCFASQLLSGDKSTDNILGLPNFHLDTQVQYGLRKGRGVGKASADALLEGCGSTEMFRRVAEAYKAYYNEPDEFISWRGEKMTYNWMDHLCETAHLIWMQREHGQIINMREFLPAVGVTIDE